MPAVNTAITDLRERVQRIAPQAVQGRLVWHAVVDVAERESWGMGPRGERWCVPILGGQFWGAGGFESFHGVVCAGGADRQTRRPDGIKELDALYEMRTHDGAVITVHNQVLIDEIYGCDHPVSAAEATTVLAPNQMDAFDAAWGRQFWWRIEATDTGVTIANVTSPAKSSMTVSGATLSSDTDPLIA